MKIAFPPAKKNIKIKAPLPPVKSKILFKIKATPMVKITGVKITSPDKK
jgi:hypothetical protein